MMNYKIKISVLMISLLSLVNYDSYGQALKTESRFPKNLTMGVHYQVQEFQLINQSFGSDCNCTENLTLGKRSLQTLNISTFGTLDKRWALGVNLGYGSGNTLNDDKQYKNGDYFQTKFDVFYQLFNTGDKLRPYLTSSLQLALNSDETFFSVPIGAGLRLNLKNGSQINLQAAYDAGITKTLAKNLISTVGFNFPLSKAKVAKPEKIEVPPIIPEVIPEVKKPVVDTVQVEIKTIEPAPKLFSLAVSGSLINNETKGNILNAKISLINNNTKTIIKDSSNVNGKFYFPLEKDVKYTLLVRRSGYLPDSLKLNTEGITESDTLQVSLGLPPLLKGKTIRLDNIFFDLGKDNIRKDAAKVLDELELLLRENPSIQIELSSHTDSRGKDLFNLALSQRRAQSSVNYLVSKGIARNRMIAKGYGKTKLINKCTSTSTCSEEEHQKNRRVEVTILKL
jgi:outer membrane protein OmpA-like peptidoglycan-associated protein